MRQNLLSHLMLASLTLCVAACASDQRVGTVVQDGSSGDLLQRDGFGSGGSGNGVLFVEATFSASEKNNNAEKDEQFDTELKVEVRRGTTPVTDAVVVVSSADGDVTLEHKGSGIYLAKQESYYRRYELSVNAGGDSVGGVRVAGPAIHMIDSPIEGSKHPAGQELVVRWTAPDKAADAAVETDDFPLQSTADDGTFTIPGSSLLGEPGKDKDSGVRVRRSNSRVIAGGAAGSGVKVSVRNQVEFVIESK